MSEVGNVVRVPLSGRNVYLIGTAHVSRKSVDEVKRVIRDLRPDTVCVELDATRYQAITDPARFRSLDVAAVIREKKVLFLFANLVLSAFQKRIGERLGVKPGAELLAGVETAREVGAELVLADRDIEATLKRSWANLTLWDRCQLLLVLVGLLVMRQEVDADEIEALKERPTVSALMREHMPRLQVPLIDERDRYLISKVREAPGNTVVAVVGAGHVEGMLRYANEPVNREELSRVPAPSALSRALPWLLPIAVLGLFAAGYRTHSAEGLRHMLTVWAISHVASAALFCLLAGAKPLSVLVAGLSSPFLSLHPALTSGAVTSVVETWARKPSVEARDGLVDAFTSFKGLYRNAVSRVLLVFVATNVGSALGSGIGGLWLLALLL